MAAKQPLQCGAFLAVLTALLCMSLFLGCGMGMEPEDGADMDPNESAEPAIIEEDTEDMILLYRWLPGGNEIRRIVVNHPNDDAVFECKADNGRFRPRYRSEFYDNDEKKVRAKPGGILEWLDAFNDKTEHDFVEIVLKLDENVIGYAVVDAIHRYESTGDPRYWDALVLKSVLFPQADGKYQNISEDYVQAAIEKVKSEHPVEKGGGDMVTDRSFLVSAPGIPQEGAIQFEYSDSDAVFECSVDKGQFGFTLDSPKSLFVMPGDTVYWQPDSDWETKEAFVEIILRSNDNIIGYAIMFVLKQPSTKYLSAIMRCILFPQTGGEYQDVSEEYVHAVFEKAKSMWRKERLYHLEILERTNNLTLKDEAY
jgi:hypothetical protein